jgi:hypothetical protein
LLWQFLSPFLPGEGTARHIHNISNASPASGVCIRADALLASQFCLAPQVRRGAKCSTSLTPWRLSKPLRNALCSRCRKSGFSLLHLAAWKFAFDFDMVLLFSREPGGTGEVIEIQRAFPVWLYYYA